MSAAKQMSKRWQLGKVDPGAPTLLLALIVGLGAQGAFYAQAQWYLGLILAGALLLQPAALPLSKRDGKVAAALMVVGAWAVVDGILHDHPIRGLSYLVLLVGFYATFALAATFDSHSAHLLTYGLVASATMVALTGLIGVIIHNSWGFASDQLWRASSVLTYPNAMAAVCAMFCLVALAELCRVPASAFMGVSGTILFVGLIETLSRAGLIGFSVGLVVLTAGVGLRRVIAACWAPLSGALVAVAAAFPAMARTSSPGLIALAIGGLVVGCLAGGWLVRMPSRIRISVACLTVVASCVAAGLIAQHGLRTLASSRATLSSPERLSSNRAAWQTFADHVWTGAGPGLRVLLLPVPSGGVKAYRFAHNEYLQILAELGVVGFVLMAGAAALVFRRVRVAANREKATSISRIGVAAAVSALAVHAGFDFVWHFPVIPLLAAALIGLAAVDSPSIDAASPAVRTGAPTEFDNTEFDNTRLLDLKEKETAL